MVAESPSAAASLLVSDYFDQWLAHVRTRVRIKTWEGYEALIRLHAAPTLGALPLAEVTPLQVAAEVVGNELAGPTLGGVLFGIASRFLDRY
jgi:hypothetical protein